MSEWISVEDRLPDESRPECVIFVFGVYELAKYNEVSKRWMIADFGTVPAKAPTHWMPLPGPPKESEW